MMWLIFAVIALSVSAGVGVKWAVDRIWPTDLRLLERASKSLQLVLELLEQEKAGRHSYTSDHTLDVLADGMAAGERHERDRKPWMSQPIEGHNWQPGVAHRGGGWLSGPMYDPVAEDVDERPANGTDLS